MSDLTTSVYPEYAFGRYTESDGTVRFYSRINALVGPDDVVLDVGCGRGRENDPCEYHHRLMRLADRCRAFIGIDVDPAAEANPYVSEFRLIEDVGRWPVDDSSVDLVVSDFVLEHVEDPDAFFSEVARVLRPGGAFCARTPNKRGYVGVISRLVPDRFHASITGRVQVTREAEDVFPTYYRANTPGAVRRLLHDHGMEGVVLPVESEPNYFRFSSVAYRAGAVLHKLIPGPLKNALFIFARTSGG